MSGISYLILSCSILFGFPVFRNRLTIKLDPSSPKYNLSFYYRSNNLDLIYH